MYTYYVKTEKMVYLAVLPGAKRVQYGQIQRHLDQV